MKPIVCLISIAIFSLVTSIAAAQAPNVQDHQQLAQAAGAGADFNKADRERVQQQSQAQQNRNQCMADCDTIFKGQYQACLGYPLQAQPGCHLNVDKNKAQCYQKCK